MMCFTCKWGLCRTIEIREDGETYQVSCLLDGTELEGPFVDCNRYELRVEPFRNIQEFWNYYKRGG